MTGKWDDEKLDLFHKAFDQLHQDFKLHSREEADMVKSLTDAVTENTRVTKELKDGLGDFPEVWNDIQVVGKFGRNLGRFGRWLTSIAIIGCIFKWFFDNYS